jgi:hypothetical protein
VCGGSTLILEVEPKGDMKVWLDGKEGDGDKLSF